MLKIIFFFFQDLFFIFAKIFSFSSNIFVQFSCSKGQKPLSFPIPLIYARLAPLRTKWGKKIPAASAAGIFRCKGCSGLADDAHGGGLAGLTQGVVP